ncbi:MAG TPA: hypothetical protein VD902_08045 [Symbiobacteriaceae bacterium]|nr:hypothetical protein [Symbiobacteriaceae bacterium]
MSLLLAAALWVFHGMLLWWNWGKFRPRLALLHGAAVAAVAGVMAWLGVPPWAMWGAGVLIGAVGGWGHRLAPGLWVGIGLLWAVPFLLQSGPALGAVAAFALVSQAAAALVSLTRSSL